MSMSSEKSRMSLPPALSTKPLPSVSTMNVDTNILDPVVINNNFARFVLEKKGILDAGSTFTLAVRVNAAANANQAFLPLRTGINALIQSAVIKVGTKVLASSRDYPFYETMRRQFKTPEEKSLKDMIKVGTMDNVGPDNLGQGLLQVADARYAQSDTTATTGSVPPIISPTADDGTTPVFQVKLSDLFPMARNLQLPLFVINEQVSIELTFNNQVDGAGTRGNVVCFSNAYGGTTEVAVSVPNVQFLADYLTYDDATMDQTAAMVMSETGMVLPYEDLLLTTATTPASGAGGAITPTQVSQEIAVANRRVRSILLHQQDNTNPESRLLGRYSSPANNMPESYNIRVNDSLFYNRAIQREAQKYTQLGQVFSADLNVANSEYSLDQLTNKQTALRNVNNNTFSANTYQGHANTGLQGRQHFIGVDMSNSIMNVVGTGTLVGQKPIQFEITYNNSNANDPARTNRYYALVERQFTLQNGNLFVSN